MCVPNDPPFSAIGPLFSRKSIWMTLFFRILCERPHFSDILVYAHTFLLRDFFEAACSLLIQWIYCDICLTTNNKWVQKIKGQYMNRSIFRMIKYLNGSFFSKASYMNGVGFERLARTPVPQLPPLLHTLTPPPPPPPPIPCESKT